MRWTFLVLLTFVSATHGKPVECDFSGVVEGAPPGATAELRSQEEWRTVDTWRSPVRDGKFSFAPVGPGWYRVSAAAPDRVPHTVAVRCEATTPKTPVKLRLEPGKTWVQGKVVDLTGKPLAETEVSVVQIGGKDVFSVATYVPVNAQGAFALRVHRGRSYRLYANAPGYRFDARELNLDAENPTRITHVEHDARRIKVRFELAQEPAIRGQILGPDGKPAAGATVYAGSWSEEADQEGRYYISVRSGDTHRASPPVKGEARSQPRAHFLSARHGSNFGTTKVGVLKEGEERTINLRLRPGRSVRGVLRKRDGRPTFGTVRWNTRNARVSGLVNVGDDGKFVVHGLPPEPVRFSAVGGRRLVAVADPRQGEVVVVFEPKPSKR